MTSLFPSAAAISPSHSSESRLVPIGVGVGVLLLVVVVAVCFITRWAWPLDSEFVSSPAVFFLYSSSLSSSKEAEDIETKLVRPHWDKRSGTLRGCSERNQGLQTPGKQRLFILWLKFCSCYPQVTVCVTALKGFFSSPPETAIKEKAKLK